MKTAVPSRTHKEAEAPVCTGGELEESQKRTASLQPRISPKRLFHSLQAYLYTHRKLLARIAAIFFVTAAVVGIATIRNTPEVSVVTAIPTQAEIPEAAKSEAPVASQPVTSLKIPTAPLIGDFGFSLEESTESTQQSIPAPPSVKAKEPLTVAKPEPTPSPAQPAVAEVPLPSPEPTATRKEFVEIAVELKIQDGRVAEAHVANRQPGAEAFEATALHIARQRRYPPGTSRTETLVLRVANPVGRKEP